MSVYVFTGPTISAHEACAELEASYLPPVSQGDVYRVACRRPQVIGIIDGYFESVPSVWHKEILWAMSKGTHVFGAASIGALRAAEVAPFGMEGVGGIFEAFRDGLLEDDDEVAIAHAPADFGYVPASEAMVNIRATLASAETNQVIGPLTRVRLEQIAKRLYYPDRTYATLVRLGRASGVSAGELDAFFRWLPEGIVDQKRADAVLMLRTIRERLENGLKPKQVRFSFAYTSAWHDARAHAGEFVDSSTEGSLFSDVAEELQLRREYSRARSEGIARWLTLREAERQGVATGESVDEGMLEEFRRERGILDEACFTHWLTTNDLTADHLSLLVKEEASARVAQAAAENEAKAHLFDYLRIKGDYAELSARARDKERTLQAAGLRNPCLSDIGLSRQEVLVWYFEHCLGVPTPADIYSYAVANGFEDGDALLRAVMREYCYRTLKPL
jgi:hypothetical protein